jgi:hypothetical protein
VKIITHSSAAASLMPCSACCLICPAAEATWRGSPVAVKIITHSSADDSRISQELALSLSFDHPNLVRALHYAKLRVNPGSDMASLVSILLAQGRPYW